MTEKERRESVEVIWWLVGLTSLMSTLTLSSQARRAAGSVVGGKREPPPSFSFDDQVCVAYEMRER